MIGALILIGLGALFLLINFDFVGWNVFQELWRFWPLLIVFAGLQLIVGRNPFGRFVVGLLGVLALCYVLAASLYIASPALRPTLAPIAPYLPAAQDRSLSMDEPGGQTQTVSAAEGAGVSLRTIEAHVGAATFSLVDDSNLANPFTIDSPEEKPATLTSKRHESDLLAITVATPDFTVFDFAPRTYQATIGQVGIVTDLAFDVGASTLSFGLDEVVLRNVTVKLGAGNGELSFSGRSVPDSLSIDVGAGGVTVRVPADVAIAYSYSVGAGHVDIDGETAAFGTGTGTRPGTGKTMLLTVNAGAGSVSIERSR